MTKRVGVAGMPNRCGSCGRFKPWAALLLHFVPDSDFSSEDESWRECNDCAALALEFLRARRERIEGGVPEAPQ
jgi:hypothetical protein